MSTIKTAQKHYLADRESNKNIFLLENNNRDNTVKLYCKIKFLAVIQNIMIWEAYHPYSQLRT